MIPPDVSSTPRAPQRSPQRLQDKYGEGPADRLPVPFQLECSTLTFFVCLFFKEHFI